MPGCLSLWWYICRWTFKKCFSFISACLVASASNISKNLYFSFPINILMHSWFGSLSDRTSLQISRILLGILADLSNIVWMVSIFSVISTCSSFLFSPLGTIPSVQIAIGITFISCSSVYSFVYSLINLFIINICSL